MRVRAALLTLALCGLAVGCGRVRYALTEGDAGSPDPPDAFAPMGDGALDASDLPDAAVLDAFTDPDAGPCAETPCRLLLAQCGCAPGQMCGWNTFSPRVCVAAGTRAVGETCARDHECVPGAGCIFLGAGPGVCHAFCESDADCASSSECVRITWTGAVGVCTALCDPAASTGCPSPTACGVGLAFRVPGGDVAAVALCANPGPGAVDAACGGPLDCAEGLACYGTQCRPICRMGDAACPTCSPFAPRAFVGDVEFGACP